jgi:hypothetical protein
MAENNRPDERETKDVLDFSEYNAKNDNNKNEFRKLNLILKIIYISLI